VQKGKKKISAGPKKGAGRRCHGSGKSTSRCGGGFCPYSQKDGGARAIKNQGVGQCRGGPEKA